jgi:hypothetical protein
MGSTASIGGGEGAPARLETVLIQQLGGVPSDEGRRILVQGSLLVGRDNPLFAEGYSTLSRRHAELVPERDRFRVTDLGSRHGTFVGGKRVERGVVAHGDLLEVGTVAFVVALAPPLFVPPKHPRLRFASYGFAVALEAVQLARKSRHPLVLVGEAGVGKSALADELAEEPAEGALRTWDLSAGVGEAELAGPLVVDRLDEAGDDAQRALLALLRRREKERTPTRMVVLSCATPKELAQKGRLLPQLLAHLDSWVVSVPALRDRPEDVLPIVRERLRELEPEEPWQIHPKLLARLVGEPWPGNVRALLAEIERLYLSATGAELADRPGPGAISPWKAGSTRRVASDASWFAAPDGTRVELGARRVLRAVLRALVDAHRRGAPLGSRDIARLAWPDERMLARAAANRVYVAVTSLRKLGFGASIENTGEGYRFAAGAVEIVETTEGVASAGR